jgi:hypothetical protein
MAVSYFGIGSRVNSGGSAVSGIVVPRPASIAVGDYVILFGYADHVDDWVLPVGDGIDFDRLYKVGGFQCWGKFLGTGFGSTTVCNFVHNSTVYGIVNVVYRGAHSVSSLGSPSLTVPAMYPGGLAGKFVNLIGATTTSGTAGLDAFGGSFRLTGDIRDVPMTIIDWTFTNGGLGGNNVATKSGSGTLGTKFALNVALAEDQPPNAPTLTTPVNTAVIDRSITNRFSWTFSSPASSDRQTSFELTWRNAANTSSGTITGTTPNAYVDVAGGTFPLDSTLQWQVRTTGKYGIWGPKSAAFFFSAADHPTGPTITAPTAGGTVNQSDHIDWSVTAQDAYQVRRLGDTAGSADTGTVYFDTGEVTDGLSRSLTIDFETNNRYEHIQVRVKVSGVWSNWSDVRVLVSYTPPPGADVAVYLGADEASIDVVYSVPDPAGGQPPATSVDIYYSTDGGDTRTHYWGDMPISGTVTYPVPASGVDYVFKVTARADNGTQNGSDWISRGTLSVDDAH